jgi:mRNA (guanine-N7-)-methyltransferase
MTSAQQPQGDLTGTVAKHYNELQEAGLEERVKSRIFYQRNFNNWIKSMAISDILWRIKKQNGHDQPITVLDLCSGKGGDLLKWKKGEIDRLVCADIAGTSVEQCEARYKEMLDRAKHERGGHQKTFTAQFITADCTKQRLRDLYEDRHIQFDLVSCQFSFHYSFESLPQAEMMLQNACENLKPGGYFIGTLPNAYELIMAEKYNMKLVFKTPFAEFFGQKIQTNDGRGLIGRMQGLEPYPPDEDVELMSKDSSSYDHAKKWMEQKKEKQVDTSNDQQWRHRQVKIGTLSRPEWEASSVYLVFAFQRCPTQVSSTVTAASPTEDVANEVSRKRKHEDECK